MIIQLEGTCGSTPEVADIMVRLAKVGGVLF